MEFTERDSGLIVPAIPPARANGGDTGVALADWDRFRHCNHERVDNGGVRFGGGMRCREHLDKPLSQSLWVDLVHRFGALSIWIIATNETEWTVGRGPRSVTIYVDSHEANIVNDIDLGFNFW